MTAQLAGRIAVITGAGSGLGAAMGRAFASAGMAVAALDIDEASAQQTATQLAGEFGVPTTALRVDVGDAGSVAGAARHVEKTLGGCDVLCANVGVQQFGAIDGLSEQDWQWVLGVNVLGTVRTVREFLPLLRARSGWRRIVLTASTSVLAPGVRMGAYQTSKFAVMGFGETLREELAGEGIGVTLLFPGGMATRHLASSAKARPAQLGAAATRPEDLAAMLAHRPLADGDVVTPEHAIRNLLADLIADVPYIVTHGSHRAVYDTAARRHGCGARPHGGFVNEEADRERLRRLLDIEEIKRLKARYFRTLDRKEWDGFGQVFAREAVMEVPEAKLVQRGPDAIVKSVSTALTGARTVHHGHMPEIEFTGPDTARGIWAMFDYVEWPPSESGDRVGLHGYGHYEEEYVREDGAWRIARLRLVRLRVDPLAHPAAKA